MPSIQVSYKHGFMGVPVAEAIKRVVRLYGVSNFSNDFAPLKDTDFSFKFLEPSKYDELTHDIIVRITPSFVSARHAPEAHAERLAELCLDEIDAVMPHDTTIGVEITVDGRKGWGEAPFWAPKRD